MSSTTTPPKAILDATGDLTFIIGEEKHEFLVNRKTLRFASPVWKKMLDPDGPFMEGGAAVLSLPDDSPGPMLLVLSIAHLQFAKLANVKMNRTAFIDLAILCDKYDMAALVKPFLQTLEGFDAAILGVTPDDAFGAWTFGLNEPLQIIINGCVNLSSKYDQNVFLSQSSIEESRLPAGLIRKSYLHHLLASMLEQSQV